MLYRAAFWLLLPLTALQGLWLRCRATRLPGAPWLRRGHIGDGAGLNLLAIGDSIIDGFHPAAESCTLWARELAAIESRSESK